MIPVVIAVAEAVASRLAQTAIIDRIGLGAIGAIGTYLGYEKLTENLSNPFGSAPSGTNNKPVTLPMVRPVTPTPSTVLTPPAVPSVKPAVQPTIDEYIKSHIRQADTTKTLSDALVTGGSAVKARNDALAQSAGASKFLGNQVESKASLDEIGFAVNAQSVVHAMIYETLERNLSLIATALTAGVQVANVSAGQATTHAKALTTISDRLEPFEDNQIHRRTVAPPIGLETVHGRTAVSPREASHAKDFVLAREKADINSIGAEHVNEIEDVLGNLDVDSFKLMNFISVAEHLQSCVPDVNGNYLDFDWSKLDGK